GSTSPDRTTGSSRGGRRRPRRTRIARSTAITASKPYITELEISAWCTPPPVPDPDAEPEREPELRSRYWSRQSRLVTSIARYELPSRYSISSVSFGARHTGSFDDTSWGAR